MRVQVGGYAVQVWRRELPGHFGSLSDLADLSETFGPLNAREDEDGSLFCVSVSPQFQIWPALLVTQRFSPDVGGFDPGVLIVPETGVVLVGAGERLLAYRLDDPPVRLWEDTASVGFWWWDRQGDTVLMAAELEFAAWDLHGRKRWSMFVEPPWSYSVHDGVILLDVMDHLTSFPLPGGPQGVQP
ncbi:hypothetical protein [Deinococcus aquiradiocola]|uniref:Uncharacterized protein n=1 Tax=Deinococcus aquiradiocola TaxID=393059 RepID=A0A917UV55_9DEIO|nr:hypothetical protein [Deinococcus aquiradiocola]GGJ87492.1 hypothetical protein GCM10008939_34460 [Deinococcus aquiradiocola]